MARIESGKMKVSISDYDFWQGVHYKDLPLSELHFKNCVNKVKYKTEAHAWRMKNIQEKKNSISLKVYSCPCCKGWHLTKQAEVK